MRVLWVTDEVPDPRRGGGSLRQFQLLRRIAEQVEVDLLVAGHVEDVALRSRLRAVVEMEPSPPSGLRIQSLQRGLAALRGVPPAEVWAHRRTAATLRQTMAGMGRYSVVNVEHESLAGVARRPRSGAPKVLTLHNLVSTRLAHSAAVADSAPRQIRLRAAATNALRFERQLSRRFDRLITVSDVDALQLGGAADVVPNGVDLDSFAFRDLPSEPRMVMTATWSWAPNEEAAIWAARQLLPRVRARIPEAELVLVGRCPPSSVTQLTGLTGVTGHFDVPDVTPHLARSRVAIVPLRVGSGTRLKALEAMAAGRPLVGTRIGLEGLGLVEGSTAHFAETADDMAVQVVRLCIDDGHARRVATAARRRVEEHFGWDPLADRLLALLAETAGRRRASD